MTPFRTRILGFVFVGIGMLGLAALAAAPTNVGWPAVAGLRDQGVPQRVVTCTPPVFPGQTVDVVLSDMGRMMGGTGMMSGAGVMNIAVRPTAVSAGEVSFRAWNQGTIVHELVVLPLPPSGAGTRAVQDDGTVSEAGSLGEASRSCGAGAGEGISPGAVGWVTLHLDAGRYELVCNLPGHYERGMYAELDVT